MKFKLFSSLKKVGAKSVSGAKKGTEKLLKNSLKVFKRKPKNLNKGRLKNAKNKRLKKLKRWGDLFSNWYSEETYKDIENTNYSIKEQRDSTNKVIEYQPFFFKKFFYKRQKFSNNKVLDDILNDCNKKNQLKEHRINETEARIDYIFNRLANKETIQDISSRNPFFIQNKKDSNPPLLDEGEDGSIFDFLRDLLRARKRKKFRLKRLRDYLRRKLKSLKEKIKKVKEKIKKAKEKFKSDKSKNTKTTKTTKNAKNTKNTKTPHNQRNPKLDLNDKPQNQEPKKTKTPNSKSSKYPDLEEALAPAKKTEELSKKEIKAIETEYKTDMNKANKEIADLEKRYKTAGFFESRKIELKLGVAYADKARLASYHEARILWSKGEFLVKQVNTFKDTLINKVKNVGKSVKETFPKMFKLAKGGAKFMAPIAKKIPIIGSILYAIISIFEIANAKNAWEVRKSLASAIGGSIGGILGAAIGSIIPLLGTLVFGIIGSIIGEYVGEASAQIGLEPVDFLPFDLYNADIEKKKQGVREGYEYSKRDLYSWSKNYLEPKIREAQATGKYLDTKDRETTITTLAKKSAAGVVDGATNLIAGNVSESGEEYSKLNPDEIEGAVVKVVRERRGVAFNGKGFVAGHLYVIDGKGKTIFEANTTERPNEGTEENKNLRIPPGTYNMYWGGGPKHPDRPVLHNTAVPPNRSIMIHKGHTVEWTAGCVVISHGDPFGNPRAIGVTGSKQIAEKAGHDFMVALKRVSGLEVNKTYFGKPLKIKTQVFNKFSGDVTAGKSAKGSETYVKAPQKTINKTIENNTTIILKAP